MATHFQWQDETQNEVPSAVQARLQPDSTWDKRAIQRISTGDEDAMLLLYDRYSGLVFSLALNVLHDNHAAEDVTQETFLHIWRNARTFNPDRGSLAGWLAVMTRHRAIDVLRGRSRSRECALGHEMAGEENSHRQAELSEAVSKLAAALPAMPEPQRIALALAYFSGMSHSEISFKIGEPLGTVKSRIRMALGFLRKSLSDGNASKGPVSIDSLNRQKRR